MGTLYYYTTAETMKYILTQGDIFATHISYLNDSEEYVNGLRELRELFVNQEQEDEKKADILDDSVYEDALKEIPQIYSISFSKEADLLSQWYMYARESGVCLGLSFSRKKQKFQVKKKCMEKDKLKKSMKSVDSMLRDVHYFTRMGMPYQEYQNEKKLIDKMIQKYADEIGIKREDDANVIRLWKEIAPYIKNYEFRQEREVRLVFNAVTDGENVLNKDNVDLIEYRNANGVLIPYIDVYRTNGWPVVEIMVGPGRNQARVFSSICHFVDNNDLKIPKIDQRRNMQCFINGMSSYQVEEDRIRAYCKKIEETVANGQDLLTYKGQIYDILKDETGHEKDYLERNYYSNCGIIVRKSNAPYVFF